jgi:hypothetical protein
MNDILEALGLISLVLLIILVSSLLQAGII